MSKLIAFPAAERTDAGKGASRRLRRDNKVPAILYGAGRPARALALDHDPLLHASQTESFYSSILELKVDDGRKQKVIVRDLQRHPFKPRLMHIDFQRVRDDEELRITVPIHFSNEETSPAGKTSGVVISHQMNDVEIMALPENLPEFIHVDLAELEIGQSVMLSELNFPEGVKPTAFVHGDAEDNDVVVVSAAYVAVSVASDDDEAEDEDAAAETEAPAGDDAEDSDAAE
ncbi:MAG: 50S ribosomal protein L25/general stress protein Ctc [Gammaproteobacteria bacterium]|nr:50S ribosomal protein L25/general stress protein Ctc [Gammaproteobacteria bacterium]